MSLFSALCFIWFLSEIFLARAMRAKDSAKSEDKSSLKTIWITICVSIPIAIFLSKTNFGISNEYDDLIYYSGIFLVIFGIIIRWISILTLKKSFTVNVAVSDNQEIVQIGIYKFIRHPAYTGSLLSFLGLGIAVNNWLSLICIFMPIYAAFYYRIVVEESVLKKAFGIKYESYTKRTGKLLPKIL